MRLGALAQSGLVCSLTKRILPIGGIAREGVDTPPDRRVKRKGEDGAGAVVDEVVEVDGSTTEDDGQGAPLDQRENEADPESEGEGGIPDACTDSEDSPAAARWSSSQRLGLRHFRASHKPRRLLRGWRGADERPC